MSFFLFSNQDVCLSSACGHMHKDNKMNFHVSTSFYFKSIPLFVFLSKKISSNNDVLSINKKTERNQTFGKYLS